MISLCCYCKWECCIELHIINGCWETLDWENDFITIIKRVTSGIKCIWCIVWLEDACAKNELVRCGEISCCCLIESERLWIWSCWYILNCPAEVLKLWITECSVINCYLKPDCWAITSELSSGKSGDDDCICLLVRCVWDGELNCCLMSASGFACRAIFLRIFSCWHWGWCFIGRHRPTNLPK